MIKKILSGFLILFLSSILYISFFGINTDNFNQRIEKKFEENYPGIKIKLNDIKILLNISKISIDIKTDKPLILSGKEKIKLKNISTTYSG